MRFNRMTVNRSFNTLSIRACFYNCKLVDVHLKRRRTSLDCKARAVSIGRVARARYFNLKKWER
ncbi:hypothetical protein, partial [Staphylococcus aureus]|uniref:hypothetical protein n=1 Tax=Staphylococcus aureus TaxID=1280 RepID=UPI001C52C001